MSTLFPVPLPVTPSPTKAESIAKLGTVKEEADESAFWLELIIEGSLMTAKSVQPLLKEANELTEIFTASLRSAKSNSETDVSRAPVSSRSALAGTPRTSQRIKKLKSKI